MENESSSIFENDFFAATAIRRRELMSTWLKIYIWGYIALSALILFGNMFRVLVFDGTFSVNLLSVVGIVMFPAIRIISCLFIWMERKEAILLALVVTGISLSAQCATIIYLRSLMPSFSGLASSTGAILLELPFLVMLVKIKKDWETMAFSKRELESKSL